MASPSGPRRLALARWKPFCRDATPRDAPPPPPRCDTRPSPRHSRRPRPEGLADGGRTSDPLRPRAPLSGP
jgi:hypothetical protein